LSPNIAVQEQASKKEGEKQERSKLENATDHRVSSAGDLRILTPSDLLKPFANQEIFNRISLPNKIQ
jgi:hypothetical protein